MRIFSIERSFLRKITFILSALLIVSAITNAQSIRPKQKFNYEKLEDGTKVLSAYIFYKGDNGWLPLENIDVNFSAENDSTEVELASVKTNSEGYAILHIDKGYKLPVDEEGKTTFAFESVENDSVKSVNKSLNIIDSDLIFDFVQTEKSNKVKVKAVDAGNNPIEGMQVDVFIKRMHSLYPIGGGETDADGMISVESPKDIPGDKEGIIKIIAKVEKDRKYGNLQVSQDINWGVPNTYFVSEDERSLWSEASPLWLEIAVLGAFAVILFFFGMALRNVYLMTKDQ